MLQLNIYYLSTFFFLYTFSFFGQNKHQGLVLDENSNPISFVNIISENKHTATTSDKFGKFPLNVFGTDANIVLTAIGYKSKTVKVSEAETVVLKKEVLQLKEVFIEYVKNKNNIEIGGAKMMSFYHHHHMMATHIPAKFFKYKPQYSQTKFIKEAVILTKSRLKNATFKLRMFSANSDGSPGEDIIKDDIIVKTKKGKQKNVINLSDFKITFPTEGVFVGFEWINSNENKVDEENYKGRAAHYKYSYQPYLMLNWVDVDFTYSLLNNKWIRREREINHIYKKTDNMNSEPAINLVLTD